MSSLAADLGTVAHSVLESCLLSIYEFGIPLRAEDYVGQEVLVEDGPHGRLSPSGAKRWLTCSAAPGMEAQFPEAKEGPRSYTFDEDYARAVQVCLDYVSVRKNEIEKEHGPVKVHAERRVSPERYLGTTECDGTSDITLVSDTFVEHIDFKAGAGVPVSEKDPQNQIYFLGTLAQLEQDASPLPETAWLTIVQPRCEKVEPRIRSAPIEGVAHWMVRFISDLRAAVEATQIESPAFNPSAEGCRFCSAKGACKAHQEFALRQAGVLDEDQGLDMLPPGADLFAARDTRILSGAELRHILDAREILTGALQAAEAWALELMEQDAAPAEVREGYKLVRGRSLRKWALDVTETERRLKKIKVETDGKLRGLGKKDLYLQKLVSPAQAEKVLAGYQVPRTDARWEAFGALVDRPKGKLTIAPRADPRDEVLPHGRSDPQTAFGADVDGADAPPIE